MRPMLSAAALVGEVAPPNDCVDTKHKVLVKPPAPGKIDHHDIELGVTTTVVVAGISICRLRSRFAETNPEPTKAERPCCPAGKGGHGGMGRELLVPG